MTNQTKREEIAKKLVVVIGILLIIVVFVVFFITAIQRRNNLVNNIPSYSFVEEDLEADFCTLDVRVLESEQNDEIVVYKVWANNAIWKVTYYARYLMGEYWEKHDVTIIGYMSEEDVNK